MSFAPGALPITSSTTSSIIFTSFISFIYELLVDCNWISWIWMDWISDRKPVHPIHLHHCLWLLDLPLLVHLLPALLQPCSRSRSCGNISCDITKDVM